MEFDEALERVGTFGRFQCLNYALLLLPVAHTAIYMMNHIFASRDLPYRCYVPECDGAPGAQELDPPWLAWAVPPSQVQRPWPSNHRPPDTCLRYAAQRGAVADPAGPGCWPETFITTRTETCDRWVFPQHDKTLVSEFNITCAENRWKLTMVGSINFMGQLLGMPFAGVFSDRFGRRGLLLLTVPLSWASGMARSFAPNYTAFLVFEMLDAFFAAGIYSACFILGVELMAGQQRVVGSSLVASFYSLGCAFLGAVAWWQPDWRWLTRVAYVPAGLSVVAVWLLPESVRWLLSRNRVADAQAVLKRVAAVNGVPLSAPLLLRSSDAHAGDASSIASTDTAPRQSTGGTSEWPVLQVIRSRLLLRRLFLTAMLWVVNSFVYFGLALRSVALAGDLHLNFILAALVEIPSYVFAWYLSERWGRRVSVSASLALTGGSLLAFLVLPSGLLPLQLILYLTGKLAITASFTVLFVFTAELFPTNARHSMIGVCSTIGRMGSTLAPQTPLLEVFFWGMPILLFGLMSVGGAFLALLLPETLNKALPDNVTQAKAVGRVHRKPAPSAPSPRLCHVSL
ncbi:solute carrier family 22 member 5-like [Thrips palmi]|uniref:Solute carrier family 22 member 5-like n=1 Tax=Thrips palmi TaxID=161013 RepID=A0A6P8ZB82_THRPL|nr:solute carrier family 22 member 5-like [Thrips palmi]